MDEDGAIHMNPNFLAQIRQEFPNSMSRILIACDDGTFRSEKAAAAKKKEQAAALAARLAWADMKAQPPTLPEHGTHTSRTRTLLQRRRPPVDPFYQPRGGPLWKVAAWPTRDKQEARRMMPTHYTWLGEGYM